MPRHPRPKPTTSAPVEPPATRRVLLVEPDQMLASILKRRLAEAHAVTVDTVLTARRMQEQMARRQYRLVLVDMSLNVVSLIPQITSQGAQVVVTTPSASPADVRELTAAGADAVLITSQYTPDGVVTFLRKYLS